MPSVRAARISFAHVDRAPLFTDATFHLTAHWTGLVGENGAGKTTLLRLLAGELVPDAGELRVEPAGAVVVTCPQTVATRSADVERLGAATDAASARTRGHLRLTPADLARWDSLSPGERKRWQIGAALAAGPELLLLDEPTNHLDAEARALLIAALRRFAGLGVVVSHDRALLDELTRATLRAHRGSLHIFHAPFSAARREWEREQQERASARERARDEERAAARRLDAARRAHASARASTSSRARMKDRHDHDARGALAKGRAEMAERRLGRAAGVARAKQERAAEAAERVVVERPLGRSVFVGYSPAPSTRVLTLDAAEVCAGPAIVLRDVHVAVDRGSRVRVEGPNGSGKTTLLEALRAASRLPDERVLHVPQDLRPEREERLVREVRALPPEARGRTLSIVAALGVDPDRLLATSRPSPGEARKLLIALGLGRHVWAALLDEPTNHLDLPSIERLEGALAAFPGALVLVSHDRRFAARVTTRALRVDGGRVHLLDAAA
jgi:ATPase subunit of ABC transporter with duplicated ATPase domains